MHVKAEPSAEPLSEFEDDIDYDTCHPGLTYHSNSKVILLILLPLLSLIGAICSGKSPRDHFGSTRILFHSPRPCPNFP